MNKPVEDFTQSEIIEALNTPIQPNVLSPDEIDELKKSGVRDISEIDMAQLMAEATKTVQVQRTLQDIQRASRDKKSPREYLEQHIEFLASISNKSKAQIVETMTVDHAIAALKTTAKMNDVPELVIKKHLKMLRKKYIK